MNLRSAGTLAIVVAISLSAACGKKGPPLAPLVPIPAAVELVDATRFGDDVYVSLTIPAANIDQYTPADLARVEIYGYTGRTAPPRARWVEFANLIATIPVALPPPKPGEEPAKASGEGTPSVPANAPIQGAKVSIRDVLTPDELVQGKQPVVAVRDRRPAVPDPETANRPHVEPPLKRFYAAIPFNKRGRPGPPGKVAELPLLPAADAPPSVVAKYSQRSIVLDWEPAGGLLGFLLERTLAEELLPFDEQPEQPVEGATPPEPAGPVQYNVYREILPDASDRPGPSASQWHEEPMTPVNPLPIPALTFTDNVEFGRRRCYTVRGVRGVGPAARIGSASPPACLTPIDTFPPAAPRSVTTVASEGVITLIWEPNTELDVAGYIVLRGENSSDTLQPITQGPVADARYRDETVSPGVRYVYAVVAIDNRMPVPNMSAESSRVEETAR